MAIVKYLLGIDSTGKYDIGQSIVENFQIDLPSDRVYQMAIDQSTSCSGIYITDKNTSFHLIMEVVRTGEDKRTYYRYLKQTLKVLTKSIKVNMIIIEKPVPSKYRSAGNVLRELKGRLEEWIIDIPAFDGAVFDSIMPQTWKSKIIDKTKGTGRFNDKHAIAEDISDKFPVLRNFLPFSGSDKDGFDACGILHGYKASHYNEDGVKVIKSTKENRHHTTVFFKYLSSEDSQDANILFKDLDIPRYNLGATYLAYNNEYSFYNNIRMASSSKPFVFTYITDPIAVLSLLWEYGLEYKKGYTMFMFILRTNSVTKTDMEYLNLKNMSQTFN